ncbi:unnamed protein product [Prunus brigantina]
MQQAANAKIPLQIVLFTFSLLLLLALVFKVFKTHFYVKWYVHKTTYQSTNYFSKLNSTIS